MPLCICRGRQPARQCDVRGCTSPTARLDQESRRGQRCFRFKTLFARWVARRVAHSPGFASLPTSQISGRGPLWKFPKSPTNGAQTVAPSSISRTWLYPPSLEPRPPAAAPPPGASTSTPSSTPIHSSFFTTHFLHILLPVGYSTSVPSHTSTLSFRRQLQSFTGHSYSRYLSPALPYYPPKSYSGPFEYKQQHQVSGELFFQAHDQSLYAASQLQYRQSIQIVAIPTFFDLFSPHL